MHFIRKITDAVKRQHAQVAVNRINKAFRDLDTRLKAANTPRAERRRIKREICEAHLKAENIPNPKGPPS